MRFNKGWVKSYREYSSGRFGDDGYIIAIYTILTHWANIEKSEARINGMVFEIPIGSVLTSIAEIETATKFSRQTVRRVLLFLENSGLLKTSKLHNSRLVAVVQKIENDNIAQPTTNQRIPTDQPTTNQQPTNNQPTQISTAKRENEDLEIDTNQRPTNDQPTTNQRIPTDQHRIRELRIKKKEKRNKNKNKTGERETRASALSHARACARAATSEDLIDISSFFPKADGGDRNPIEGELPLDFPAEVKSDTNLILETQITKPTRAKSNKKGPPLRLKSSIDRRQAEELLNAWNAHASVFEKALKLTRQREKLAIFLLKENPDLNFWKDLMRRLSESSFCIGINDRGWIANFDWFLRPDTYLKILEGKYDDRKKKITKVISNEMTDEEMASYF
jgi:Fe2+ or Zn2+ uptake regulation protein